MPLARTREVAITLTHAVIGWALCSALIGVGRRLVSLEAALVIHAVGAPVFFGLVWGTGALIESRRR